MNRSPNMQILWVTLLLGLAAGRVTAQAPAANDVSDRVARYARIMADKPATDAWKLAQKFRALGADAVPPLLAQLDGDSATVRIAAATALIHFGEHDRAEAALLTLAKRTALEPTTRATALRSLGLGGRPGVGERIHALMQKTREPALRLAAARALWRVSLDRRPAAKTCLEELLRLDDPDLRIEAALALAAIEEYAPALAILRSVEDEPSQRGRLARSYLRTRDAERQLQSAYGETSRFVGSRSEYDVVAEVIHNIRQFHVDGEVHVDGEAAAETEGADKPRRGLSREEMLEAAARGMLRAMDPHSTYFTAKQRAEWMFDLNKNYGGIGAFVNFNDRDEFTIIRPIYSGPAYKAGLRTDDTIAEVDGWSTRDQDLNEIIKRLKGPPGTEIMIKVARRGWKQPRDIAIKRARIRIDSVRWEMLPGKIGLVELTNFGAETSHELDRALATLNRMGMRGLVLDLRNNQGGYLPTAVKVADKFLDQDKLIVYWEGRNKRIAPREEIRTTEAITQPDYPMVVLTNEHSASASEIVAGALQCHGRAKLVGKRSYGKGSVQQILPVPCRPGDILRDRPRKNGVYDTGETFGDKNGNGRYDEGEPFTDQARQNRVWDPAEEFEDKNGNGKHDPGEPFTDSNKDGRYNGAEAFEDFNGNGKFDVGPGIKITIARYYLPDGRCIHKERDRDGVVTDEGGIAPDIEVKMSDWPGWKEEEVSKLLLKDVFRKYVEARWKGNEELFNRLATFDGCDASAYPEFEAFYQGLATDLDRNDVRRWLRIYVRRRVMDYRGREFVGIYFAGDFQEDRQLQRAILEVLEQIKPRPKIAEIAEYRNFPEQFSGK